MDVSVCAVVCVYVISDAFSQCILKNIDKRTMREKKKRGRAKETAQSVKCVGSFCGETTVFDCL